MMHDCINFICAKNILSCVFKKLFRNNRQFPDKNAVTICGHIYEKFIPYKDTLKYSYYTNGITESFTPKLKNGQSLVRMIYIQVFFVSQFCRHYK